MLPLHHALTSEAAAEVSILLMHAHPPSLRCAVKGGRLPLHLAVANHAPADAVRELLRIYPLAASTCTADGLLPLHVASEHGASAAVVDLLLRAHPSGARQRTHLGRLPLQLVARRGIVGTDAEDVTTRRSAMGAARGMPPPSSARARAPASSLAGSGLGLAPLAVGDEGAPQMSALGGVLRTKMVASESTWRAHAVVTGHAALDDVPRLHTRTAF